MRLILSKGTRKREIEAPFGLCASRDDMESLRDQINVWLEDKTVTYGFLFVQKRVLEFGPLNTHPEPWE